MNQLKRIAKTTMNVLCIVLFIILVLVIYAKVKVTFTNDKANANYFGYRIFEIASGSMEPTLKKHDLVLIKVSKKNIKENDVISYIGENNTIITHRVIKIENGELLVKGDANNTNDTPIKETQVIGKMVHIYPQAGIWKRILTEPKTLILLLVTFVCFDAALSYNPKKQDTQNKETTEEEKPKEQVEEEHGDKELLEFTRRIDLKEIDSVLKKGKKEEIEVLNEYGDGYTVRLDLNEIQKNIKKVNK